MIKRLERLHADGKIDFDIVVGAWMDKDEVFFDLSEPLPDVILIPADRKEMVQLAVWAYYRKIPIFHLWAGIGNTGTWDDLNRRVISSFSYLMLCEDEACRLRLIRDGEEAWRCIVTGTPHFDFDDTEIDESKVPDRPYDLVLVKPNPIVPGDEDASWRRVFELADKDIVEIGAGEGEFNVHSSVGFKFGIQYYGSLGRPQFLGLLKNCERFISNSSAAVYEAPYFGVEVCNPGKRNSTRTFTGERQPGAADRIVNILANYPIDRAKLLKVYD